MSRLNNIQIMGKVKVAAHIPANLHAEIKHLAIDHGLTVQNIATAGIEYIHDKIAARDEETLKLVRELSLQRPRRGRKIKEPTS